MSFCASKRRQSAFTLVEFLATIAILAVMASVAISAYGSHTQAIRDTRDRRNAQEMVALCAAANAAGLDFVIDGDLEATVRLIIQGETPATGVFKNHTFRLVMVGEDDIVGVMRFLKIENSQLQTKHDA